ncbi:MAG: PASTA domain-containing protein [Candidatus Aminicenantes bacterium]|nr:PASTA domain-containing protein [Candidatus Aminicenantes bacterium]
MTTVPDLEGKIFDQAKEELFQKKLSIVQSGLQVHEKWEQGKIIFQDPPAGSKIKLNKVVKVILSTGKEKVLVPNFIGKSFQTINQTLQESGLKKGKISHVHTPKYAAGKIMAQFPQQEEEVGRDTYISFLISQGEIEKKYLMPDLIGKRAETVIAKLKEMDFRVGDIRYVLYPGLESGIIIKQFPTQGFRIQKRNLITLEVSK